MATRPTHGRSTVSTDQLHTHASSAAGLDQQQLSTPSAVHLIEPRYVPMSGEEYRETVQTVAQILASRRQLARGLDIATSSEVPSTDRADTTAGGNQEEP
jgi:hypothetical protein